jgi:hypothetical protein
VHLLISLLIATLSMVAQATQSFAGRPLLVDDAGTVEPGHIEVELGVSHSRPAGGGREQALPEMMIAYGVIEWLEIGLGIQRANDDERGEAPVRGFEDLHLATKFSIIKETETLPAATLSMDVSLPTANKSKDLSTGNSDQLFTLILSKDYTPAGLHLNVGYLLVDSPRGAKLKNRLRGGVAADYALNPVLALVGAVFGASRAGSGQRNEAAFQLGIRYAISSRLVLDAAAGRSLRSSGASLNGTAGLTWTLDIANMLAR